MTSKFTELQLAPDRMISNNNPEDPVPTIINIFWSCDPYFELQPKEGGSLAQVLVPARERRAAADPGVTGWRHRSK